MKIITANFDKNKYQPTPKNLETIRDLFEEFPFNSITVQDVDISGDKNMLTLVEVDAEFELNDQDLLQFKNIVEDCIGDSSTHFISAHKIEIYQIKDESRSGVVVFNKK